MENLQLKFLLTNKTQNHENKTEQNRTEQNRTEQNRTEQNRTEQNRTEQTGIINVNDHATIEEVIAAQMDHFKTVLMREKKMPVLLVFTSAEKTPDKGVALNWNEVGEMSNNAAKHPAVSAALLQRCMKGVF